MDAARISTQQLWKPEGFRVARCATLLVGRSRQPQTCAALHSAAHGNFWQIGTYCVRCAPGGNGERLC
jgi:hypothetical protein